MIEDTLLCPKCGSYYDPGVNEGLCSSCLSQQLLAGGDLRPSGSGEFIDDYLIGEKLGEGAMGVVWRARQVEPVEREVAVKILKPGLNTREVLARFRQEQQSLAIMDHPDIAWVIDAGRTADGHPYFVMELVVGEPITRYFREHDLSLEERLGLFERVCGAVQHAHSKGVIHRDLKPSNILVGNGETEGEVRLKVIDFGIAKAIKKGDESEQTLHTLEGQVFGTPGYMSPEQASGTEDIDTRSDVYSLGALLYELLCDQAPFTMETTNRLGTAALLKRLLEEEPVPPRKVREGATIPRELDWIAMKALSSDRERRYATAAALGEEIQRFLRHEPVTAAAPGFGYRLSKFVRKHRAAVSLWIGLMLALLIAVGSALRSARIERGVAQRERGVAGREQEARIEVQEMLSRSRRDAGVRAARDGQMALAALWFEMAGGEVNETRAQFHREASVVPVRYIDAPFLSSVSYLRFDHGGNFLIETGSDGGALLFDLVRGELIGEPMAAACFSVGSMCFWGEEEGRVQQLDLRTRNVSPVLQLPVGCKLLHLASSENGQFILAGSDRGLSVWHREEKRWVAELIPHQEGVLYASMGGGGSRVLTVDREYHLRIFDLLESPAKELFAPLAVQRHGYFYDALPPRFTDPSGIEFLALVEEKAGYFDSSNGRLLRELGGVEGQVYEVYDDRLATSVFRGREIGMSHFLPGSQARYLSKSGQVVSPEGVVLATIPFSHRLPYRFSPDAMLYASRVDEGILVARLPADTASFVQEVEAPLAGRAVFSRESKFFASAGGPKYGQQETRTRVFDSITGEAVSPVMETGSLLFDAAFSKDGEELWTVGAGGLSRWNWREGRRLSMLETPSEPRAVQVHPTEDWMAVACVGGELIRVDREARGFEIFHRWEIVQLELGLGATGSHLAFSGDGRRLYLSGIDCTCLAFDLEKGVPLFPPVMHQAAASDLLLQPDILLVPGPSDMRQWFFDPIQGHALGASSPLEFYRPSGVALSPDGQSVLVSTDQEVGWIDWRSGKRLATPFTAETTRRGMVSEFVVGRPWAVSVEKMDDGRGGFFVWELDSGMPISPVLNLPRSSLRWISRSPDGTRLVMTSKGVGYSLVDLTELCRGFQRNGLGDGERLEMSMLDSAHDLIDGRPVPFFRSENWAARWREFMADRGSLRPLRSEGPSE